MAGPQGAEHAAHTSVRSWHQPRSSVTGPSFLNGSSVSLGVQVPLDCRRGCL